MICSLWLLRLSMPGDPLEAGAWLAALLVVAWAVRLLPMLLDPSGSRPDEIFQSLEPAHRLLTGWGIVSWEWRDGIRSWLFPGAHQGRPSAARALTSSLCRPWFAGCREWDD